MKHTHIERPLTVKWWVGIVITSIVFWWLLLPALVEFSKLLTVIILLLLFTGVLIFDKMLFKESTRQPYRFTVDLVPSIITVIILMLIPTLIPLVYLYDRFFDGNPKTSLFK